MFLSKFSKRDLFFSIVTGVLTGTIVWQIFNFLEVPTFLGLSWSLLVFVVPIVWMLGVTLGYFLGRWLEFFNQFGKFAAIGFTNAAVDFGVLNILLAQTGFTEGGGYAGLKTISFTVGLLSSYVWNKNWAFYGSGSARGGVEFGKFVMVTVVAFIINVSIAYTVTTHVIPIAGFDAHQWANVGAVVGSAVALVFSFIGFKLAVFRK